MRSRLALLSGSTASALALAQKAVAAAKAEHGADRIKDRYHVASEVRLLGDVRMKSGDSPGAKDEWGAGLAALPSDVSEQPWEMQERADLLRRLARGNEAQNIDRKLSRIGYHSIF